MTGDLNSRIPSRLLDRCDDELVLEAVETLEVLEDAWLTERRRQMDKARERERNHG